MHLIIGQRDITINMDKRPIRIVGLKALLCIREVNAAFCDLGFAGTNISSESRNEFRRSVVSQIDAANKETCLTIADLYGEMGNKPMEQKYYSMAKRYAHMGVGA